MAVLRYPLTFMLHTMLRYCIFLFLLVLFVVCSFMVLFLCQAILSCLDTYNSEDVLLDIVHFGV